MISGCVLHLMESKNRCRSIVLYVLSARKIFMSVTLYMGQQSQDFEGILMLKNVVTCDSLPDRCLAAENIQ